MKKIDSLDPTKKTLILLNNLGTPEAPTKEAVRPYLKEFLMDKEVIAAPFPIRWMIVNLFILPTRPAKSAEAYAKIWDKQGSPLMLYSLKQCELLSKELDYEVDLCMRYGNPSIASKVKEAIENDYEQILFFPLYPQYSTATTRSSINEFYRCLEKFGFKGEYKVIEEFCQDEGFISSISNNIQNTMNNTNAEHLIMSFHGIPESMLKKNDPGVGCLQGNCCAKAIEEKKLCYRSQCFATTNAIAKKLGLSSDMYTVCFQSRLGPTKWLSPYTDEVIEELARNGKKRVAITSPAFTADCLETLEELAVEGEKSFQENGGDHLQLVPAVNDSASFIQFLKEKVLSTFS
jgi:ferrochelatase